MGAVGFRVHRGVVEHFVIVQQVLKLTGKVIDLNHLDSGRAARHYTAGREGSLDVVSLAFKIKVPRPTAYADGLHLVLIGASKVWARAVERQERFFTSGCQVNLD